MSLSQYESQLRRSKSLCSLDDASYDRLIKEIEGRVRTISDSSAEMFMVNDSDSDYQDRSGRHGDKEMLAALEKKMDRLSDLFIEQCSLLAAIKKQAQESRDAVERACVLQGQEFADLIHNIVTQRVQEFEAYDSEPETNIRARSLMDAIEVRRSCSLDSEIKEVLTTFLQSDELKDRVVSATTTALRDVVRGSLARDLSARYVPTLERAHRRLTRHITCAIEDAFVDLEENWAQISRHMYQSSRTLRRALERPRPLPETARWLAYSDSFKQTIEGFLDKELKQWREKALEALMADCQPEGEIQVPTPAVFPPFKPPLPADPVHSIIDQLMMSAEIIKQIQDGDVNGSFSRALSAADLSLVTAACRAADPARVFAPCRLDQPVLLSLMQQLATDILHDTQLKCRYLEDAIINLNTAHPATRAHLPVVVGEVRTHLMNFLLSYPKHVASKRVTLIIMAADNLLKCS